MHLGQVKGYRSRSDQYEKRLPNRFIPEVRLVSGICVKGVYNPHQESAEQFAARWGIEAYGDPIEFSRN